MNLFLLLVGAFSRGLVIGHGPAPSDPVPSRARLLPVFDQILDPEEELAAEVALVLVDLATSDLDLGLEHAVPVGKGRVRGHRDVGGDQGLVLDLVDAVPGKKTTVS